MRYITALCLGLVLACDPTRPPDTPCCDLTEQTECRVEVTVGAPEWGITGICYCKQNSDANNPWTCHTSAGLHA